MKKPRSELEGIPIAIKDNFCTKNVKTTCGSKMLEHFIPPYNATVCQRLFDAGAVLVGKTNLDEFAMGSGTVDSIYGVTKNVWGSSKGSTDFYIAGGSSGGSAVAVATGSCFGAFGSDTGGSTRNPASYCGLVGLKPTYGLISRLGLIPLVNSMDVPGILTRTVDDCVSLLNATAGPDPKDSTCITKPYTKLRIPPADKLSIKNLKIGIPKEYACEYLDNEVLHTWNEIASFLENSGAHVIEVEMPHTELSIVCYSILNQCEVASNMARYDGVQYGFRANEETSTEKLYAKTRSIGFNDVVKHRILTGNYFLLTRNYERYFEKALKLRRLIATDFDNVFEKVQILLTPTTLTTAPLYSEFITKSNSEQCSQQDYCTQPANMAGIPAVSIPIKLSSAGLPISLQLMGRNFSEPTLLALAKFIENEVKFPHIVEKIL
ncbi:glutamyl-tRNA(Gln) amidotransferase subunit A, mitochondrial isoform X2 [Coccinella septempunctata]|nr:glutamyl-tRNA(Gln) amidotransferase subunit A, mitochondrial isoform X2 [Coccinella septempunctata]